MFSTLMQIVALIVVLSCSAGGKKSARTAPVANTDLKKTEETPSPTSDELLYTDGFDFEISTAESGLSLAQTDGVGTNTVFMLVQNRQGELIGKASLENLGASNSQFSFTDVTLPMETSTVVFYLVGPKVLIKKISIAEIRRDADEFLLSGEKRATFHVEMRDAGQTERDCAAQTRELEPLTLHACLTRLAETNPGLVSEPRPERTLVPPPTPVETVAPTAIPSPIATRTSTPSAESEDAFESELGESFEAVPAPTVGSGDETQEGSPTDEGAPLEEVPVVEVPEISATPVPPSPTEIVETSNTPEPAPTAAAEQTPAVVEPVPTIRAEETPTTEETPRVVEEIPAISPVPTPTIAAEETPAGHAEETPTMTAEETPPVVAEETPKDEDVEPVKPIDPELSLSCLQFATLVTKKSDVDKIALRGMTLELDGNVTNLTLVIKSLCSDRIEVGEVEASNVDVKWQEQDRTLAVKGEINLKMTIGNDVRKRKSGGYVEFRFRRSGTSESFVTTRLDVVAK